MCNYIPEKYNKIPKTGFGYKVFGKAPDGRLFPLVAFGLKPNQYHQDENGWICWSESLPEQFKSLDGYIRGPLRDDLGDGFCFCKTLKSAIVIRNWATCKGWSILYQSGPYKAVICKIRYADGLGQFPSEAMGPDVASRSKTAICKRFKIIREL